MTIEDKLTKILNQGRDLDFHFSLKDIQMTITKLECYHLLKIIDKNIMLKDINHNFVNHKKIVCKNPIVESLLHPILCQIFKASLSEGSSARNVQDRLVLREVYLEIDNISDILNDMYSDDELRYNERMSPHDKYYLDFESFSNFLYTYEFNDEEQKLLKLRSSIQIFSKAEIELNRTQSLMNIALENGARSSNDILNTMVRRIKENQINEFVNNRLSTVNVANRPILETDGPILEIDGPTLQLRSSIHTEHNTENDEDETLLPPYSEENNNNTVDNVSTLANKIPIKGNDKKATKKIVVTKTKEKITKQNNSGSKNKVYPRIRKPVQTKFVKERTKKNAAEKTEFVKEKKRKLSQKKITEKKKRF